MHHFVSCSNVYLKIIVKYEDDHHIRDPLTRDLDFPIFSAPEPKAGSKISTSSTKFVFWNCWATIRKKNKMARWPWPLIGWDSFDFSSENWNRWTEFNKTWQEERSQRPLPSLCFLGRSEKQDGCPSFLGQSVKKVAHCTQVHDMWPFGPLVLLIMSEILTFHTKNKSDRGHTEGTNLIIVG